MKIIRQYRQSIEELICQTVPIRDAQPIKLKRGVWNYINNKVQLVNEVLSLFLFLFPSLPLPLPPSFSLLPLCFSDSSGHLSLSRRGIKFCTGPFFVTLQVQETQRDKHNYNAFALLSLCIILSELWLHFVLFQLFVLLILPIVPGINGGGGRGVSGWCLLEQVSAVKKASETKQQRRQ